MSQQYMVRELTVTARATPDTPCLGSGWRARRTFHSLNLSFPSPRRVRGSASLMHPLFVCAAGHSYAGSMRLRATVGTQHSATPENGGPRKSEHPPSQVLHWSPEASKRGCSSLSSMSTVELPMVVKLYRKRSKHVLSKSLPWFLPLSSRESSHTDPSTEQLEAMNGASFCSPLIRPNSLPPMFQKTAPTIRNGVHIKNAEFMQLEPLPRKDSRSKTSQTPIPPPGAHESAPLVGAALHPNLANGAQMALPARRRLRRLTAAQSILYARRQHYGHR